MKRKASACVRMNQLCQVGQWPTLLVQKRIQLEHGGLIENSCLLSLKRCCFCQARHPMRGAYQAKGRYIRFLLTDT